MIDFSNFLFHRLESGIVSPITILKQIESGLKNMYVTTHCLEAVVSACGRWYESQHGYPDNMEGSLFFSLNGKLLNDLGRYDEALEKEIVGLKIEQRVLPADHPNIAASLNNMGNTLGELGRHDDNGWLFTADFAE